MGGQVAACVHTSVHVCACLCDHRLHTIQWDGLHVPIAICTSYDCSKLCLMIMNAAISYLCSGPFLAAKCTLFLTSPLLLVVYP